MVTEVSVYRVTKANHSTLQIEIVSVGPIVNKESMDRSGTNI